MYLGKLQHFTRFQNLPKELRFKIWELALPPGRIVEIEQIERRKIRAKWNKRDTDEGEYEVYERIEELGYEETKDGDVVKYEKLWGATHDDPLATSFSETFFDFQKDTLYITPDTFADQYEDYENGYLLYMKENVMDFHPMREGIEEEALSEDFKKVENLALLLDGDDCLDQHESGIESSLFAILSGTFRNVKTLTIVLGQYTSDHYKMCRPRLTDAQAANLVFMDELIDVRHAMWIYRPINGPAVLRQMEIEKPRAHPNIEESKIDETLLAELHRAYGGGEWVVPKIQYKIAISTRILDQLKMNKAQYRRQVRSNQRGDDEPWDQYSDSDDSSE